jgi:predicted acyltransferase
VAAVEVVLRAIFDHGESDYHLGLLGSTSRLVSLDAFRGATIAAMILVNNPGSWSAIYWPLEHARWHGWTPTDLIFPFFLFIVGVSLSFSRRSTFREALKRSAILFALGLFMAAYPFFNLTTVRIPGVLQRIAVCYLAAWLVHRAAGVRGAALIAGALLAAYWLLMTRVPVPGGIAPNLEPETNLAAWIDRALLSGHLWKQTKTWDPEGLLSTLPAIATTLLGSLAGAWVRSGRGSNTKTGGLLAGGAVLTALGLAWGLTFPINKNLWTSSYVLFTGGLAAYLLGLFYWLADVRGHRAWTGPLVVYGRNAIFVFVASGLVAKTLVLAKVGGLSLQEHIHRALFTWWLAPPLASLAYALANVAVWYAVLLAMDRRGVHLTV